MCSIYAGTALRAVKTYTHNIVVFLFITGRIAVQWSDSAGRRGAQRTYGGGGQFTLIICEFHLQSHSKLGKQFVKIS